MMRVLMAALVMGAAPFVEELLFRGVLTIGSFHMHAHPLGRSGKRGHFRLSTSSRLPLHMVPDAAVYSWLAARIN